MAAFATMSLNDGQTTPVAHSFTTGKRAIDSRGRLEFNWLDLTVNGGVPAGANTIQLWVAPMQTPNAKNAGDVSQVCEGLIRVVSMETLGNNTVSGINPQPRVAFTEDLWFKHRRNGRSGQAQAKDAVAFTRNLLAHAMFTDLAYLLQPPT